MVCDAIYVTSMWLPHTYRRLVNLFQTLALSGGRSLEYAMTSVAYDDTRKKQRLPVGHITQPLGRESGMDTVTLHC